jgi:hypothetical protein
MRGGTGHAFTYQDERSPAGLLAVMEEHLKKQQKTSPVFLLFR